MNISEILERKAFTSDEIKYMLEAEGEEKELLFKSAQKTKAEGVGNVVYFRGLIEYSNICAKNCYYCGVRSGNKHFERYMMTDEEVVEAAKFAHENKYASIVLQAGERSDKIFTDKITELLHKIHAATNNELRVTLSLGEQSREVYQDWYNAGAHRYLLRIETSNPLLYSKMHPQDEKHMHEVRVASLKCLQEVGYQVGTGIMVGLPFQDVNHLVEDIQFFRDMKIDMFGLGPYIEHENTPLYQYKDGLWTKQHRFEMSLRVVAILRLMLPDVNIAATTAMQAIDKLGREKAIKFGANVIMPNLTPVKYRAEYLLYEDKPCIDEDADVCQSCLGIRIKGVGNEIGYGQWGDSKYYTDREGKA